MSPFSGLSHGGDDGIRTHDPLLAGQVLSQLSYTPVIPYGMVRRAPSGALRVGSDLSSRDASIQVFSALHSLTTVFGMGTGGPCALEEPTSDPYSRILRSEQQDRNLNSVDYSLPTKSVSLERR